MPFHQDYQVDLDAFQGRTDMPEATQAGTVFGIRMGSLIGRRFSRRTVGDRVNGIAALLEPATQKIPHLGLVLDDQHAHASSPVVRPTRVRQSASLPMTFPFVMSTDT